MLTTYLVHLSLPNIPPEMSLYQDQNKSCCFPDFKENKIGSRIMKSTYRNETCIEKSVGRIVCGISCGWCFCILDIEILYDFAL